MVDLKENELDLLLYLLRRRIMEAEDHGAGPEDSAWRFREELHRKLQAERTRVLGERRGR
jgi:hypothetical protein